MAVLGAGGWGTALAVHLARAGHQVRLWGRDPVLVAELRMRQANAVYLPDVTFPSGITATADIAAALAGADLVVAAVPSHGMREVLRAAAPHLAPHAPLVS